MTCPVNVRKRSVATIYILNAGNLCYRNELFGYHVISHKILSAADANEMYNDCSFVTLSEKHDRDKNSSVIAYTWSPAESGVFGKFDTDAIFGRATGAIIASGLPIVSFRDQNHMICIEIDADFKRDPLSAIRDIGVPVPGSIRQEQHRGITCDELYGITQ